MKTALPGGPRNKVQFKRLATEGSEPTESKKPGKRMAARECGDIVCLFLQP